MRKATLIAGLATMLAVTVAGPASAHILPVGVWPFNSGSGTVAHDASRFRDNGTLQGGVSWSDGRFGHALTFDGTSGAVDVPNASVLEPAQVTVSAWVNSTSPVGNFKYILGKGANGCLAASYGLYTGAAGGLQFYVSTGGGTSWALSPDSGSGIWDGNWHSVIGTYDGLTVRLYVDGAEVGSGTPDTSGISYGLPTSNDLMIGDYAGCSGLGFAGSIDQVQIFDRALDPREIGFGVKLSSGLPRFFPFDLIL